MLAAVVRCLWWGKWTIFFVSGVVLTKTWWFYLTYPEAYSEPSQTSKMKLFVKIVNGYYFGQKISNLDIWKGSEYPSVIQQSQKSCLDYIFVIPNKL